MTKLLLNQKYSHEAKRMNIKEQEERIKNFFDNLSTEEYIEMLERCGARKKKRKCEHEFKVVDTQTRIDTFNFGDKIKIVRLVCARCGKKKKIKLRFGRTLF